MDVTEIVEENYFIKFDESDATVSCGGYFRLRGTAEYAPMLDILYGIADQAIENLQLDLRELEFLNSSGINVLSKFMLRLRKNEATSLKILASNEYPWQKKSLKNFQRLLPNTEIAYD